MTIEYIRYRIPPDDRSGFLAAYREAAEILRGAPQCLGYELSSCVEEEGVYILRILWSSVSEHIEGFRKSPAFGGFLRAVRPFIDRIEEMRHYEATDLRWLRPGSSD